jgi:hypothetical protein
VVARAQKRAIRRSVAEWPQFGEDPGDAKARVRWRFSLSLIGAVLRSGNRSPKDSSSRTQPLLSARGEDSQLSEVRCQEDNEDEASQTSTCTGGGSAQH